MVRPDSALASACGLSGDLLLGPACSARPCEHPADNDADDFDVVVPFSTRMTLCRRLVLCARSSAVRWSIRWNRLSITSLLTAGGHYVCVGRGVFALIVARKAQRDDPAVGEPGRGSSRRRGCASRDRVFPRRSATAARSRSTPARWAARRESPCTRVFFADSSGSYSGGALAPEAYPAINSRFQLYPRFVCQTVQMAVDRGLVAHSEGGCQLRARGRDPVHPHELADRRERVVLALGELDEPGFELARPSHRGCAARNLRGWTDRQGTGRLTVAFRSDS